MVKVYCDMCGRPIDFDVDGINVHLNYFGVVNFNHRWDAEKQLCIACATRVVNWIDNECEKITNEIARAKTDGKGDA